VQGFCDWRALEAPPIPRLRHIDGIFCTEKALVLAIHQLVKLSYGSDLILTAATASTIHIQ
jgi:hypothetical protein